jgi:arabinogalactan endo-1,4-beta-galactosidase
LGRLHLQPYGKRRRGPPLEQRHLGHGLGSFTQLLKAGIAGAQAGNPRHHSLSIVIHTDLGGGITPYGHDDTARSQYFYSQLEAYGVPFDVIGLSYYPIYQGSLSGMRKTVNNLATVFDKPIVLAETQYPWTLADGNNLGNSVWQPSQPVNGYVDSAGGQLSMVNDQLSILAAVPNGLGMGDFYWEPEWIPGVAWAPVGGVARRRTRPCSTSRVERCHPLGSTRTRSSCAPRMTPATFPVRSGGESLHPW